MALIGFEGFDNYQNPSSDMLARGLGAWSWAAAANGALNGPGRAGAGLYLSLGLTGIATLLLTVPKVTLIVGFAILATGEGAAINFGNSSFGTYCQIKPSQSRNALLVFNSTGTVIAQTANNSLVINIWNYIEVVITAGITTGRMIIRCNGDTILDLTNLNTSPNGHVVSYDEIGFSGVTNGSINIDDFYFADTTVGPGLFPFNTFAGDVRAIELNTVGAGASTQWTPLAGANWSEVSKVRNDGGATYNFTATAGNKDLFNFADLAGTITSVLALQVVGSYRKTDAGTRQLTQHLVSGATEAAGTTYSVPSGYFYLTDLYVLDPDTTANWTVAAVNAIQCGYVLTT